ncbi:thiol:disulfide interchange protein DsbA/DsbL [Gammaproteobacteria bacterium]|jgi:protein dithiol oxidoreductase (disulfide-forming)|nr:thiol:disulfide interchange protein DsbA/DsbL [Gammaproteobacteria bacterium]
MLKLNYKYFLFFILFLLITPIQAQNEWKYENNKHYRTLPLAEGVPSLNDEIEVIEVFAYSCNHCFNFETNIELFEKTKAQYIDFKRMPVVFNEAYKMHARIFYTAESLGILDVMHNKIFKAFHLDRKQMNTEAEIFELFAEEGISKIQFENRFRSFTIESKVNRAERLTRKYKIRSTPTMVVNGKYTSNGPSTRTFEDMIAVTRELALKEYSSK